MQTFICWIILNSLKGLVFAVLVLLFQRLLSKRIPAKWMYVLWFMVVLRFITPSVFESRISVFNLSGDLWKSKSEVAPLEYSLKYSHSISRDFDKPVDRFITQGKSGLRSENCDLALASPLGNSQVSMSPPVEKSLESASGKTSSPEQLRVCKSLSNGIADLNAYTILFIIWSAGALFLLGVVLYKNIRFYFSVRRIEPLDDSRLKRIISECEAEINIRRKIAIIECPMVSGPAMMGIFKPTLLLPLGLREKMNDDELAHVFLHELAHLRRMDLLANWFFTFVRILHWFNPFLLIIFSKVNQTREEACDEKVMRHVGAKRVDSYALTILKLLEFSCRNRNYAGVAGILNGKKQLERRILRIKQFKTSGWKTSLLMIIMAGAFAISCLSESQNNIRKEKSERIDSPSIYNVVDSNEISDEPTIKRESTLKIPERTTGVREKPHSSPLKDLDKNPEAKKNVDADLESAESSSEEEMLKADEEIPFEKPLKGERESLEVLPVASPASSRKKSPDKAGIEIQVFQIRPPVFKMLGIQRNKYDLGSFLIENGVSFDERSTIKYLHENNLLFVENYPKELSKIQKIVQMANRLEPQVLCQVKTYKILEKDLAELGWKKGADWINNVLSSNKAKLVSELSVKSANKKESELLMAREIFFPERIIDHSLIRPKDKKFAKTVEKIKKREVLFPEFDTPTPIGTVLKVTPTVDVGNDTVTFDTQLLLQALKNEERVIDIVKDWAPSISKIDINKTLRVKNGHSALLNDSVCPWEDHAGKDKLHIMSFITAVIAKYPSSPLIVSESYKHTSWEKRNFDIGFKGKSGIFKKLTKTISVEFQRTSLSSAMKYLTEKSDGLKIKCEKEISELLDMRVSLDMSSVSIKEVLRMICEKNNLFMRYVAPDAIHIERKQPLIFLEARLIEIKQSYLDKHYGNVNNDNKITLESLSNNEGSNILSAPKIIFSNHSKALVRMVREEYFPIKWQKPHYVISESGKFSFIPSMPIFDKPTEFGIKLEVASNVLPESNMISLDINTEVKAGAGYIKYKLEELSFESARIGTKVAMPDFSSKKILCQMDLQNGETALVGHWKGVTHSSDTGIIANEDFEIYKEAPPSFWEGVFSVFADDKPKKEISNFFLFVTPKLCNRDGLPIDSFARNAHVRLSKK